MYCDIPEMGRCCFCLPLRRGVLTFGYLNLLFSCFLVGVYSYCIHHEVAHHDLVYHGLVTRIPPELCIAIYCIEILACAAVLYGAHFKIVKYIRFYYYFSLTTSLAAVLMQIVEMFRLYPWFIAEFVTFGFAGFCVQMYLLILVRSLLRKLERSGPHQYENQLNEIVTVGDKIVLNGNTNQDSITQIN